MEELVKIKIKIKELFSNLGCDNNQYEEAQRPNIEMFIKTPTGDLAQINHLVKKHNNKILQIELSSGVTFKCSENHLIQNADGSTQKVKDAKSLWTTSGIVKIKSKKYVEDADVYDIAIPAPHLYITPNGVIHHNTTLAKIIATELDMDLLYINGSMETSIDLIRYKVQQFAMTSSFHDGKKLVIIDEADRMSVAAMEALKVLQEESEVNCRFIFCTNNLQKIIQPLQSRSQTIVFGKEITKDLIMATFKRMCFILDTEKISHDKKVVAEITQKFFPDIRKLINELQKFAAMHGKIDATILQNTDEAKIESLVEALKAKKFTTVRQIATGLDPSLFYSEFYAQIDTYLQDKSKPDIIMLLAESAYQSALSVNPELTLVACLINIMRTAAWR